VSHLPTYLVSRRYGVIALKPIPGRATCPCLCRTAASTTTSSRTSPHLWPTTGRSQSNSRSNRETILMASYDTNTHKWPVSLSNKPPLPTIQAFLSINRLGLQNDLRDTSDPPIEHFVRSESSISRPDWRSESCSDFPVMGNLASASFEGCLRISSQRSPSSSIGV
jgi:hypothetical protein